MWTNGGERKKMIQSFYQKKPVQDTPYRELRLFNEGGWHVLLLGGTTWGAKNTSAISDITVTDFDEGKLVYDRIYGELSNSGWRPYTPYETWD
jgi:hypothetical protein